VWKKRPKKALKDYYRERREPLKRGIKLCPPNPPETWKKGAPFFVTPKEFRGKTLRGAPP